MTTIEIDDNIDCNRIIVTDNLHYLLSNSESDDSTMGSSVLLPPPIVTSLAASGTVVPSWLEAVVVLVRDTLLVATITRKERINSRITDTDSQ